MRSGIAFLLLVGLAAPVFADEDACVGDWYILSTLRGQERRSHFTIERRPDGTLTGTFYDGRGGSIELANVTYDGHTLRFVRSMGSREVGFSATIEGDLLEGRQTLGTQTIEVIGANSKDAFDALIAKRRKERERGTDLEADYDKYARRAAPRDAFPVLFDPMLLPASEAKGVREDEPVIGIYLGGEAKAYPISIMGVHELANDTCGGQPIAASW